MISARIRIAATVGLLILVAACSTPIYKVESKSYGWGPQKGVTLAQVQATVEKTALDQGWALGNTKPGSFTATRNWGGNKHGIVVDVVYDLKSFSIRYKDSKQMGYTGASIHRTYNDMVQRLEESFMTNVSELKP